MAESFRDLMFQPSYDVLERERRKALCKITRQDGAVGWGCLFYEPKVQNPDWSEYFIITSSKLIPKKNFDGEKYQVEFTKPNSKLRCYPLESIIKKSPLYVSSGLVVIFVDSECSELNHDRFRRKHSSVLSDLEPEIGVKESKPLFVYIGSNRYKYIQGKLVPENDDSHLPSPTECCSTVLLEEGERNTKAVGILNFEVNEQQLIFDPVWFKKSRVEDILGLPDKPTIQKEEGEADVEFTLTWLAPNTNCTDDSPKYRLEWRKKPLTGSSKLCQQGNIVETHFKITNLEFNSEYEVKLFAFNRHGESEPEVMTFKTKTGLPEKPTITNTESEVDNDFTVTWSEVEANSSNGSIKYRLEWRKQPMIGSTELVQQGNIVETHYKITGLEYDAEYEMKLFAVNKQGDSEPDVRIFKTKSGGVMNIIVDVVRAIFGWRQTAQRKMKSATTEEILGLIAENYLQTTPPQSREEQNHFITYLREMRVLLTGVSIGSLLITVKCDSLESLERLWEEHYCGHLDKMVQDCFVTEKVLKELHLVELKLKTTMDIEEYNACKVYFERDALRALKSSSGRQFSHSSVESGQRPLSSAFGTQGKPLQERSHTRGLPEKPTITNVESEVDKDFTVTWSEVEANSSNYSIKYRLEWTKQPMIQSTELVQRGNIMETHYEITGLEYDAEYEVKLFAVNKQGDSEPDVRTFKTKSAITAYTTTLKTSITDQTEFQPKLLPSHTISNAKTDEIFTNLIIQHGRKRLTVNDEYFGKVSGTPVKHCDEIFLGTSNDQENPNSILVVGKAGIGKSLFCQKVIRDWANKKLFRARENIKIPNFKFAYLLTFRQLNLLQEKRVTLREILNFSSVLDDVTFEYIVNHPEEVLIILDGYGEYSQQDYITGNSGREYQNDARCQMPVAALCSKLIKGKILKGSVVVVTLRPDESDKLGGIRFKRYVEIVGLSSEQVKEYIEKYFKKDEKTKNDVLEHVIKNENLVSFAHIPKLCYLLCFEMKYTLTKSGKRDGLPVSTTDIYTKLIDIFELRHCAESIQTERNSSTIQASSYH